MDIKVNRGVLRFVKMNHITEKNLNVNKEAPQSFSSKYQREGCPCVLLKKGDRKSTRLNSSHAR